MSIRNTPVAAVERIEVLLRSAAAAHGVYEETELGGVYDQDWPRWYAEHIARSLAEQGLEITTGGEGHGAA